MDSKIVSDQTYEEIDESFIKIEKMEHEQNFNPENLDINFMEISSMGGYDSNVATMPKCRGRFCTKRHPLILPKVQKGDSILKKRFRPIRPKLLFPLVSTLVLKPKNGLSPAMNMTALPNRVIVPSTVPTKEKFRYTTDVPNKTNNCIRSNSSNNINNSDKNNIGSNINIMNTDTTKDSNNSNILNILPVTEENDIDKIVKTRNSNTTANSNCNNNSNSSNTNSSSNNNYNNCNNCDKDLCTVNAMSKSHKNSIKLFFESMAQTVWNLPNEVQADIKMQICKIVTMAEIKYCGSQAKKCNTEN